MTPPLQVDTVVFTDSFDIASFVRGVLAGEPIVGSLPTDGSVLSWWTRAWPVIDGSPYLPRVQRAIVDCVTDANPEVRAGALALLEQHPTAIDTKTITTLLERQPQLFAGVKHPWQTGVDLKWALLRVLGAKMSIADEDGTQAIVAGEHLALREPKDAAPLAAALAFSAPEWTEQHAEALTNGRTATAIAILNNLQDAGRDLREVGARLGKLMRANRQFRERVNEIIEDPVAKKAILNSTREQ